ncbi:DNA-binding MarR family transcriptional regulator [Microbacterium sp. AK009]|uniref:MarR family winged helix-turn-helix transcriptional regulator n=1 Tax=Microbacterium sp. AK009 TaxID=2723068 RepID=UPI0018529188|nr:MarR family transcriptional regulator [Microbacterium sp. AK009]NYF15993.1 DNA-binding MarR family transcriptional regulator [Microbacterium sp. AK009]
MKMPFAGSDAVDEVVAAWTAERPDLDLSAIAVVGRLGRVANLLSSAQQRVFDEYDLQSGEFDVLATLRRAGSPYELTPTTLASALLLSKAGMTARLDRLVRGGLIDRKLDELNRRSFRVRLTPKGFEVVDAAMTAHTANVIQLLEPLGSPQRDQLDETLRILLHGLSDR